MSTVAQISADALAGAGVFESLELKLDFGVWKRTERTLLTTDRPLAFDAVRDCAVECCPRRPRAVSPCGVPAAAGAETAAAPGDPCGCFFGSCPSACASFSRSMCARSCSGTAASADLSRATRDVLRSAESERRVGILLLLVTANEAL